MSQERMSSTRGIAGIAEGPDGEIRELSEHDLHRLRFAVNARSRRGVARLEHLLDERRRCG